MVVVVVFFGNGNAGVNWISVEELLWSIGYGVIGVVC